LIFERKKEKREKKYCHEKKRKYKLQRREKKKRKLYRRVIGVGVLLLGVRKGKFRVV